MAAAVLLRSLARKMARTPATQHPLLPARGLHGGARSASVTQPPTRYEQGRWDQFGAAAAGLRSLARAPPPPHHRLVHERALHSLKSPNSGASGSTSTPPTKSKPDRATPLVRIRAGVACVLLFGSLVYMYGWLWPQRFQARLEARTRSILNDAIITEALEVLRAKDVSTNGSDVQIKQSSSSGHQKQHVGDNWEGNNGS